MYTLIPAQEVMMIRSFLSLAVIAISLAAPVAGGVQQTGDSQTRQGPPASFPASSIERSYAAGAGVPSRSVRTRTESGGHEVITETTEVPGPDGKMKVSLETTTDTVRTAPDSTQTRHEVFTPDAQGRRRLVETTQTDVQTFSNGSSRSIANTWAPDLNGRLEFSAREVQETRSPEPNVRQTDITIYRPGINEPLLESERQQQTERKVGSDVTQVESTKSVRDGNGRWQTTETRSQEVRIAGSERVTEESVRRLSDRGTLSLSERKVTRQSKSNGQDQTVTETYSESRGLMGVGASDRLDLKERVRLTTSATPEGGQQTIREVEARSPGAPNEPLRVVERTVETLRKIGPDRWEVQRQVFALDGNGRLAPVLTEKGESGK